MEEASFAVTSAHVRCGAAPAATATLLLPGPPLLTQYNTRSAAGVGNNIEPVRVATPEILEPPL